MSQQTPSRIDELIRASWTADAPPDYRIWTNAIINDPESPIQALRTTLTALTDENRSQIFARQFLDQLSDDIQPLNDENKRSFCEVALECLQARNISFEQHVNNLKMTLADLYEKHGEFVKTAEILNSISVTANSTAMSIGSDIFLTINRLAVYLRIVKLYLMDSVNDPTKAELALNRATAFLQEASDGDKLLYQLSHARILDYKQKYLDAAQKYYQLSLDLNIIADEERAKCLLKAINCAILSPAGKNRTRLICAIYKDIRAPKMLTFALLEKVYKQQIINEKEVQAFSSILTEKHYQQVTPEGWTLIEKAMKEHNIFAISLHYKSLCFQDLGRLLGIPCRQAEQLVANMILEKRLSAELDQVDEYIRFEHESQETVWNYSIRDTCDSLLSIVEKIQRKHPVWYEKTQRMILNCGSNNSRPPPL